MSFNLKKTCLILITVNVYVLSVGMITGLLTYFVFTDAKTKAEIANSTYKRGEYAVKIAIEILLSYACMAAIFSLLYAVALLRDRCVKGSEGLIRRSTNEYNAGDDLSELF